MPRPPLNFTARECKTCGRLCAFQDFTVNKTAATRGFSLSRVCIRCRKVGWRRSKFELYHGDPEYRLRTIDACKRYRESASKEHLRNYYDYQSQHAHVKNNARIRLLDLPAELIVFAVPKPLVCYGAPTLEHRYWTKYAWITRQDRPGIKPPQFGIPILRIEGTIASRHPSCPDQWAWCVAMTQRWIARNHKGQ